MNIDTNINPKNVSIQIFAKIYKIIHFRNSFIKKPTISSICLPNSNIYANISLQNLIKEKGHQNP